jgi:hypothetical protein
MSIDLGNDPQGTPPDAAQKSQIRTVLGVLPVAGGTMEDNATIGWHNGSAIREAGEQGLELECSVGYRWQWVAGRMIMRLANSSQIARIIAIDNTSPLAGDDETQGFYAGSRWETADGVVHVCTNATTDAAVWVNNLLYAQLDDEIGTPWRINVPIYAGDTEPESLTIYSYDTEITLTITYAGDTYYKTLYYAGQYNGAHSYNLDGTSFPEDPSAETDYTGLYWNSMENRFYLQVFLEEGLNAYFQDSTSTIDISTALSNPYAWTQLTSCTLDAIDVPSNTGFDAEINGQFYEDTSSSGNYYFSSLDESGQTTWHEFVKRDGNAGTPVINLSYAINGTLLPAIINGYLGYDKGGTNAVSRQGAVNNVGGWITDITSSRNIAGTDANAILSCNGTITLTIPQNLDSEFTCQVLRYGTGAVNIAAAAGVTLLSQTSHKYITSQYDIITITRVALNTYVLSGNLKATA